VFLEEMEQVVPWGKLCALIERIIPSRARGDRPLRWNGCCGFIFCNRSVLAGSVHRRGGILFSVLAMAALAPLFVVLYRTDRRLPGSPQLEPRYKRPGE
jgi:hypothetical protein